ncbi:DUF305 domain-containing protein [Gordonia sp. CPCC 205333]|uniref:DUF305 domain-containing protein n=1 Tax=Gordonia sp. CPCC 205333 TaxID=3140790 RepID=UPI003AF37484
MTLETRKRWLSVGGLACAAMLLLAIGAAVGVAVEHHRDAASRRAQPSATDIGFAQDMAAHHDQAILMSRSLPGSADAEIRSVAQRIISTQTAEVATMRGWLTWFGEPLASTDPMSWMPSQPAHRHNVGNTADEVPMPGMASVTELTKLAASTGGTASIFFLQLMIRHHRGGVSMAQAAFNAPDAASATKQLALSMIGDQGDEIGQMTLLLTARGGQPLTP